MNISEIYSFLNRIYKFDNQESWDNSRLVVNNGIENITEIMVCLDINKRVLELAIENNIQLIIAHHPLFINPPSIENYHSRKIFGYLKKYKINLIFLHTPFDKSIYGMNTNLAFKLGLQNIKQSETDEYYVIGDLTKPMTLQKLAHRVKDSFELDEVKFASGYKDREISKVAILGGSGAKSLYGFKGADVLITGDIKYHAWVDSIDLNVPLIEINHDVENIFVDIISEKLLQLCDVFNIFKIKSKINFKTI